MINIANAADHVEVDPKAELTKKMEEVRRIAKLSAKEFPRWTYCIWLLALVSFAWMGFALGMAIPTQGFLETLVIGVMFSVLLPIALSHLLTVLYVKAFSVEHTDMTVVFELLEQYDPVDKQAYQVLQQETRKAGHLKEDNVKAWAEAETNALHCGLLGPVADSFLNKKV